VRDFRCFEQADIEPCSGINVITGDNASGKTTLLEALFFLGRGRSFRQSGPKPAIRRGCGAFTLNCEAYVPGGRSHRIGVHRDGRGITYRCDGEPETTRLDLINTLPLQLMDPNVHRLLEQGPRYRRHFMDWGVFHVEHAFFPAWRRYRRALRQRNKALKAHWPKKDVIAWDAELVHNAELVDAARRGYIDYLQSALPKQARRLLGDEPVTLEYESGWRGGQCFGHALAAGLERDIRAGFTQQGPHRSDLRVTIANTQARDWVSRGQQKILTTALLLVQAKLLFRRRGISPVLLIDDMAAELGSSYREILGREIANIGSKVFLLFSSRNLFLPPWRTRECSTWNMVGWRPDPEARPC